jgi:hypothetical protein
VLRGPFATAGRRQLVFDWPFLEQAAADRQLVAWMPWVMHSDPGQLALGFRVRSNYQGWIDRIEAGVATSVGVPSDRGMAAEPGAWRNLWLRVENPTLRRSSPLVGVKLAAWHVDDAVRLDLSKTWDISRFTVGPRQTRTFGLSAIGVNGLTYLDPAQWEDVNTYEAFATQTYQRSGPSDTVRVRVAGSLGGSEDGFYARTEIEGTRRKLAANGRWSLAVRVFGGGASVNAPQQREPRLSAQDPVESFGNHFLRSAGSPLAQPSMHYTSLGGGGLRGYDPRVAVASITSINLEGSRRLAAVDSTSRALGLWVSTFADAAYAELDRGDHSFLGDVGVGVALRGTFFDRPITLRFDVPLYVSREELGIDARSGDEPVQFRWTFSFRDLW